MTLQLKPFIKSFSGEGILRYDENLHSTIKALQNDPERQKEKEMIENVIQQIKDAQAAAKPSEKSFYEPTLRTLRPKYRDLSITPEERLSNAQHQIARDTGPGGFKISINGEDFTGDGSAAKIIEQLDKIAEGSDVAGKYTLYLLASQKTGLIFKKAIDEHITSVSGQTAETLRYRAIDDPKKQENIQIYCNRGVVQVLFQTTHIIQDITDKSEVTRLSSYLNIFLNTHGKIIHSEISTMPTGAQTPVAEDTEEPETRPDVPSPAASFLPATSSTPVRSSSSEEESTEELLSPAAASSVISPTSSEGTEVENPDEEGPLGFPRSDANFDMSQSSLTAQAES